MDLIKTIVAVLSLYPENVKKELLKNVVMVGGPSKLAGLRERISRDLRR